MSKPRNQTATTIAPIRPATTPSFRIERSADAISVRAIVCLPPSVDVAGESYTVVGVAQVRRQRGAVADRAPRVGVPPGSTPADTPRPRGRAARIPLRRLGVVGFAEPVGAPLVADAREVREPERVRRCLADARRPVERVGRSRVAPGIAGALEAAARGLLPLGLRRQARAPPPRHPRPP